MKKKSVAIDLSSISFRKTCRIATSVLLLLLFVAPASIQAQKKSSGTSRNTKKVNPIELDQKVEDAATTFMKTAANVAIEYEEAGELEKAQKILERILMLQPDLTKVRDKIKSLEEERLEKTEVMIEIDPSKGWVPVNIGVRKGNKVRFLSEGECRIIISQRVDSNGFPSEDVKKDLATGVPLGALIGVVVTRKGKSSAPFLIGKKNEVTMPQQGQLLVRINLPAGSKCTGKIRLKAFGEIELPSNSGSSK